jgi:hypothetical protein
VRLGRREDSYAAVARPRRGLRQRGLC